VKSAAFSVVLLVLGCQSPEHTHGNTAMQNERATAAPGPPTLPVPPTPSAAPSPAPPPPAPSPPEFCHREVHRWTATQPVLRFGQAQGVLVPVDSPGSVLCQCSRTTPGVGDSYWSPSERDILDLEERLPSFVRSQRRHPELRGLRRQYLGVVRGSRRMIYVNLFPPIPRFDARWTSSAIGVCDGGSRFFGVEYDVEKQRFVHADFNGDA